VVDDETRCIHYHSPLDIIAIKFKCCKEYYPCYSCHEDVTDHLPQIWKKNEFDTRAVLCGKCKQELTIEEYLKSNDQCPFCNEKFNPKCSNHYFFYFEM
jgi:uncharacterized CHY-type Zn-finger protein